VARLIRPALARGEWVVCDRYVDSSRAYQGGAGGLGDAAIGALHSFGSDGLRPDRVILIEGDKAALTERLAARGAASDVIEGRPAAYHRAVADAFRALAVADPAGFARIDGIGTPEQVHHRVLAALDDLLDGAGL
jgi:dTMP kinase